MSVGGGGWTSLSFLFVRRSWSVGRVALVAFLLFFGFPCSCTARVVLAVDEVEAYHLIEVADRSVSSAFEAVLDAEGAGANVSALIEALNEAVGSLVEAKVFFKNGDFGKVGEVAGRSAEVADVVKDEALVLKTEALSHRDFVFKISVIGSAIGVPAFLFCMFFLWRWFKGYYMRRVLRMKPEVASDVKA